MNKLTNKEILDAFPDEILEIVPNIIKQLEERLDEGYCYVRYD